MTINEAYNVLGMKNGSNAEEVNKQYRMLSKKYHPDRNPGDKMADTKYKEIQNAHDTIKSLATTDKLPRLKTMLNDYDLFTTNGLLMFKRDAEEDLQTLEKCQKTQKVIDKIKLLQECLIENEHFLKLFNKAISN